ncbi:MAG: nitroreductase family protein [bacterium]|nr:nitroreductase family protein [bacterium]
MEHVLEVIQQRYSVRAYKDRPVEEEKLTRVLEAARLAPSAKNRQEWRFIVVRDSQKRQALAQAARDQHFVGEAPVILVCCAVTNHHMMTCGQYCYPIDVAIAMEHIALQAVAEGLGTCWIGAFYEYPVKKLLHIPDPVRVVELMPLGYPADDPLPKDRLPLEHIVMQEEWRED